MRVLGMLSSEIFEVKWLKLMSYCTQNITKYTVAKSMGYVINQSCGDFQQGGYLYKPTSSIQWRISAKADQSTFGSGVLIISQFIDKLLIGSENHPLPLCVDIANQVT